jgi:hypothetical protein
MSNCPDKNKSVCSQKLAVTTNYPPMIDLKNKSLVNLGFSIKKLHAKILIDQE